LFKQDNVRTNAESVQCLIMTVKVNMLIDTDIEPVSEYRPK